MSTPRPTRRDLLLGAAGLGALAPFVPVLQGHAAPTPATRLVLFFTPHGTIRDRWLPTGSERSFVLPEILAPLARHQQSLVVLDGLNVIDDSVGAPHTKGSPLLWTASPLLEDQTFSRDDGNGVYYYGWNSDKSVDQHIAQSLPLEVPFSSLELGVRSGNNHPGHRTIFSGASAPLAPEDDPYVIFTRLFGGGATEQELRALHAQRRSVLDVVYRDVERLQSKVSTADQSKVAAHLQAIRDIEHTMDALDEGLCEGPVLQKGLNDNDMRQVPQLISAQWDLLAQAFACDLTRIASLQLTVAENDHTIYDWLGVSDEIHHLITHSTTPASLDALTLIYSWYAEQLASFLDRLAAIPEGDGTALDHTIVLWGTEIGRGWDHTFDDVPFVLAGGAGGAWETGRFLQLGGVEHNRLLVSVCEAMGVPTTSFGGTDPGSGGLPGL
ncbi:MAG: DUF1552 domain-containing protein [Myxococcales bacterium]|nr:DUF1552 domain-containing protein [Myxococcales bacterium]